MIDANATARRLEHNLLRSRQMAFYRTRYARVLHFMHSASFLSSYLKPSLSVVQKQKSIIKRHALYISNQEGRIITLALL